MTPALDTLELRQLLSAAPMSAHEAALAHHHHHLPLHHAAVVGRFHSGHRWATPTTSTGFQVVAKFNNASFAATTAIAANDIWAVGDSNPNASNQQPLAVHFNGTSWSAVPTHALNQPASFAGVAAVASNDVWAVGAQYISSTGTAQPLVEHWDGTSWSVVSSPNLPLGGSLRAVTAITTKNVWAVGSVENSPSVDLVEHWDGTSWSIISSPAFANGILAGISADSAHDMWAVGRSFAGSGAATLHFDGKNWNAVPNPKSRYGGIELSAATALSPTNAWAVGQGKFSSLSALHEVIEHWDGKSWGIVSSPIPNANSSTLVGIAAVSANDIWAVGSIDSDQTLTEHWDGTSWSIVSSPAVGQLEGVTALSDGTVVAVSTQGDIVEN
jgi:hypothetical protein